MKLKDDDDDDDDESEFSGSRNDDTDRQRKKEESKTTSDDDDDDDDDSEGSPVSSPVSPPLPVATEHASLISAESASAYYQDLHRHSCSKSNSMTTTDPGSVEHQKTKKGLLGVQPVPGIRHTVVEPFETHNPSCPYQHLSDHYAVRSLWFF